LTVLENDDMPELLRTPLYDWHVAHGGRMVEFGGWEMPVQYTGIVEEHNAVRNSAGLFDISHMGRFLFREGDAAAFLERLVTCSVASMKPGQIRYGLVCRDDGGVLDDVLVYRLPDWWGLVVNAGNRLKIKSWIEQQPGFAALGFADETARSAMFAIQGPQALSILQPLTSASLSTIKYYYGVEAELDGVKVYLSRTGYTGEDGFEVIVTDAVPALWQRLADAGCKPCGLGARDTLRLEAAMPLYGHELTESINPVTAGLVNAEKLKPPEFIGKSALVEAARRTDRPVRVGLKLDGRRIAREGAEVFLDGSPVGVVTSGTFSPTLQQSIAMAYVDITAKNATQVEVDIRGRREVASVVALPFYKRT
jgi:aminomethyltransferase